MSDQIPRFARNDTAANFLGQNKKTSHLARS